MADVEARQRLHSSSSSSLIVSRTRLPTVGDRALPEILSLRTFRSSLPVSSRSPKPDSPKLGFRVRVRVRVRA